jgi:hypothetical protein
MKKIAVAILLICATVSASFAQQDVNKDTKVKKTSNVGQKVHNTFSKHKHYNGYKVKSVKHVNGHDVKTKEKVTN